MSGDVTTAPDGRLADLRTMENVRPVGRLFDGQTVYCIRFKGDPTPRFCLLAHEVAQAVPEAVAERPDGFLTVDYGRATDRAAAIGAERRDR